jgi:hypothetical protein
VADDRLDGGSTPQFALDDAEHAALLSRDENAARVLRVMTAVPLVDIAALDLAACEFLGLIDDLTQICPSYGLPGNALACSTNWPPGARALVVTIETLTPNS